MMWKIVFLLFSIFLFIACNQTDSTNFHSANGISLKKSKVKKAIKNNYNYSLHLVDFLQSNLNNYDTSSFNNDEPAYADFLNNTRFKSCKKLSFRNKKPMNDNLGPKFYQHFHFLSYQYTNSKRCSKAFDAWIKQYGTNKVQLQRMQNLAALDAEPCFAILNGKQLHLIFTDCFYDNEEWVKTIAFLKEKMIDYSQPILFLSIGCAGPVEWKAE